MALNFCFTRVDPGTVFCLVFLSSIELRGMGIVSYAQQTFRERDRSPDLNANGII